MTGSTPAATIVEKYGADLVPPRRYSACLEPLRNKQVEAVTTDNVILAGFVDKEPDAFKLASDETFTKEPYGIGLKKDDTEFRNWINDQLEKLRQGRVLQEGLGSHRRLRHQDCPGTSGHQPLLGGNGGCREPLHAFPRQPPPCFLTSPCLAAEGSHGRHH